MSFRSILSAGTYEADASETSEPPGFFHDLNLDQIVQAVTADWKDYNLAPFYHTPLNSLDAVAYRQEVMQDLEASTLMQAVKSFSQRMRAMRTQLPQAEQHHYKYHGERCFLGAAEDYCEAVECLTRDLASL